MERKFIKSVLVVDDERAMCLTLREFLQRSGYECRTSANGAEALDMLKSGEFNLMISDIKMPEKDGMDLLREVCAGYPGIETIMMTGQAAEYTYSQIIEAGAADFIRKPFELPELRAKIERIERERSLLRDLKETNSALGVVLSRVEADREKLDTDVTANLKQLISPYLDKLKSTRLDETQSALVDILDSNVKKITSSFSTRLSHVHLNLSNMEIRVANLIQIGKGNKELAEILGVSINTVKTHRYNLRTKLGLRKEKVNLESYLKSIE
jgi:DNA-binding NarL/FixJ family response regulator